MGFILYFYFSSIAYDASVTISEKKRGAYTAAAAAPSASPNERNVPRPRVHEPRSAKAVITAASRARINDASRYPGKLAGW